MKTVNLSAMNRMDHDDVKDLGGASETQRRKYRLKIIKSFLGWAKNDFEKWNSHSDFNEERNLLNRNKILQRSLFGFGAFANFFIYQCFMSGIYNYRNFELLVMRKVPFPIKLGITTAITSGMCYLLYNDLIYDEHHYSLALKYRREFDENYDF